MSFAFNQKDRPPGIPEVYLPQKTHGNYFSGLSAMHAGYWIKYTELRGSLHNVVFADGQKALLRLRQT